MPSDELRAVDVFTPGHFPEHTYVERADVGLEQRLRDALDTPGEVVSVSGPSKSGKTVLVERVVGPEDLITITGAGIRQVEDLWERVLDWMDVPTTTTDSTNRSSRTGGRVGASGGVTVPVVGEVGGSGTVSHDRSSGDSHAEVRRRGGLQQVIREIAESSYVVLVDDYHYMPREVQSDVARQIKEAARQGVKVCTASVPHRTDDVVRGNPELRGRVRSVDVGYWEHQHLAQIPRTGFDFLNAEVSDRAIGKLIAETSGSPQLMQAACLQTCFDSDLRKRANERRTLDPSQGALDRILEETATRTDFYSMLRDMHSGPKTRGAERKEFAFSDGSRGDVYRSILLAIAQSPARLTFPYNELFRRIQQVCGQDLPQAASIYQACYQIARMAEERSPSERIIEWDEEASLMDIVDPYFLFYLRWSNRLRRLAEGRV